MNIRKQVINEVQHLDISQLARTFQFMAAIKRKKTDQLPSFLSFAGCLSNKEAEEIKKNIDAEFSKVEGDW